MHMPVTNRMRLHEKGEMKTACTSTAADAVDASAAKTRMCPTLGRSSSAERLPTRNPAKYDAMTTPVTARENPSDSDRTPSNEP